MPDEDVRDRLLFVQALEALRCFEEGVITSTEDADAASVAGWGFPAATGGPLAFVKRMGTDRFAARAAELAERDMRGVGNGSQRPFVRLSHVENQGVGGDRIAMCQAGVAAEHVVGHHAKEIDRVFG